MKTIDYEVEKVREKIKKDNDSFTDTHDFMKVSKDSIGIHSSI